MKILKQSYSIKNVFLATESETGTSANKECFLFVVQKDIARSLEYSERQV